MPPSEALASGLHKQVISNTDEHERNRYGRTKNNDDSVG